MSLLTFISLVICAVLVVFGARTVVTGIQSGTIKFISRPPVAIFNRNKEPVRFWLTVLWDSVITACLAVPVGIVGFTLLR